MNYCIIDFEATCWPGDGNKTHQMEIIEFAAVLVDKNFIRLGEFDLFVKPKLNPILTQYCTDLTSITQYHVNLAQEFTAVHSSFVKWLSNYPGSTFCSWGLYDKNQLQQDCQLHKLTFPFSDIHLNLKNIWSETVKHKRCGLTKALNFSNMQFSGIKHRGIDDAHNIVAVCKQANVSLDDAFCKAGGVIQ